jgi:hypothetical protein
MSVDQESVSIEKNTQMEQKNYIFNRHILNSCLNFHLHIKIIRILAWGIKLTTAIAVQVLHISKVYLHVKKKKIVITSAYRY